MPGNGGSELTRTAVDVAVIGGGVAGTYVAYRLLRRRPDLTVGLFESSGRIGGRLLSVRLPGADAVPAELGGMRYRTSQPLVSAIVDQLQLESRPFLTVHDDNRFFLRGARWRGGDPGDAAAVYHLAEDERGLPPGELLLAAFERVVPGAITLTDDEWVEVKRNHRFGGRPLREWSLGDLLANVLSEDGHRYVVDGFGYATVLSERNAADAIPWVLIEARPETENRTLVDGMERLPRELAARVAGAGGQVHVGHHLVACEDEPDGIRLRFDGRPEVLARQVVLAMPRRALELLSRRSPLLLEPRTRSLISSVTAQPAAKLFLAYERAWWRDAGVGGMRAVSDIPLSKTYYFDRPDAASANTALLLASYSDGPNREVWRTLSDGAGAPRDTEPFASGVRWESYAATEAQVTEAQRHLRTLHEVEWVPEPFASAFMDWGGDPFGGAWHTWNTGTRSWEVMRDIVQPVRARQLYVCGEAYSWSQGWVEGALETAAQVVERLS